MIMQVCLIMACNSNRVKNPEQTSNLKSDQSAIVNAFEKQVFILGYDSYEETCEFVPECDCCSTDLYFLSTDRFGYVDRCISGDTYYSGTYTMDKAQLTLTFERRYLTEVVNDDYEVIELEEKDGDFPPEVYKIDLCNENVRLIKKYEEGWIIGSRYKSDKDREILQELLDSEAWRQLNH